MKQRTKNNTVFLPVANIYIDSDVCDNVVLSIEDSCTAKLFHIIGTTLYLISKPPIGVHTINIIAEDKFDRYDSLTRSYTLFVSQCSEEECPPPPTTTTTTTESPTTEPPTTTTTTTEPPTTEPPTTEPPTTEPPTTEPPTTEPPTTEPPTTEPPTTEPPTTAPPTTGSPTTGSPTTGSPTTGSPTTGSPTTAAPTTGAPTTIMPPNGDCPDGTYQVGVTPNGSPICCPLGTTYNSATGACDSPTTTGTGTDEPCNPEGRSCNDNNGFQIDPSDGIDYGALCSSGCLCSDGSGGIIIDCEGNTFCCCADGSTPGVKASLPCCAAYESAGGQANWECLCEGGYGGAYYVEPEEVESSVALDREECEGYHDSCVFEYWTSPTFDGHVEISFACSCSYKIEDEACDRISNTTLEDCDNNSAGLFFYTNCTGAGGDGQNPLP